MALLSSTSKKELHTIYIPKTNEKKNTLFVFGSYNIQLSGGFLGPNICQTFIFSLDTNYASHQTEQKLMDPGVIGRRGRGA